MASCAVQETFNKGLVIHILGVASSSFLSRKMPHGVREVKITIRWPKVSTSCGAT